MRSDSCTPNGLASTEDRIATLPIPQVMGKPSAAIIVFTTSGYEQLMRWQLAPDSLIARATRIGNIDCVTAVALRPASLMSCVQALPRDAITDEA